MHLDRFIINNDWIDQLHFIDRFNETQSNQSEYSILQSILLLWIPLIALILNLLSEIPLKRRLKLFESFIKLSDLPSDQLVKIHPPKWKQIILLSASAFLLPPSLAGFSYVIVLKSSIWNLDCAIAIVPVLVWVYSLIYLSFRTITRPVYQLLLSWTSLIITAIVKIWISIEADQSPSKFLILWRLINIVLILGLIYIAGSYPILDVLPCQNVAKKGATPTAKETCPEDNVTLWQWLSFSFLHPLLRLAHERTLQEEDIWQLSPFCKHQILFSRYLRLIKEESSSSHSDKKKKSLLWILIRSNSIDLTIGLFVGLWSTIVGFVSTYAVKKILDGLSIGDPLLSFKFALLHLLCNLSFAQFDLFGKWHTRRCYERSRGQLFNILHDKALRRKDMSGVISTKPGTSTDPKSAEDENASSHANIGKISNLMAGDAYQVAERFWQFSAVVTSPLRLIISLAFLYKILGWSAFFGAGIIGLAYLLNWPLIKFDVKFSREYSSARDRRMSVATETIQSIRFLKFMGWESKWESKVQCARQTELKLRVKQMILSAIISFIWIWVPTAVLLISFWGFTSIFHQPLTVSIAFTSISLFTQLQWALQALPNQLNSWLRALVSVKRIEDFLAEDDVPAWVTSLTRSDHLSDQPAPEPGLIQFNNAHFTWPHSIESKNSETFHLGPLDLTLPVGKLTVVTGPTAAGKSSFLCAALGELDCIQGSVHVDKSDGKVAYASQMAWLESATIRDNITFQSEFDQSRYDAVLTACALTQDLAIMPHGDVTEIGEKGISLSGGQKARIALARAIYSPAKILLLDDPLSAVDMHTARNLLDGLQGDLLRNRTVVLVTHHLRLCQSAASLLVHIKGGQIDYVGSPAEFQIDPSEAAHDPTRVEQESLAQSETSTLISRPRSPELPKRTAVQSGYTQGEGRLIEKEKRHEGKVSGSTYLSYLDAAGWFNWVLLVGLIICGRFTTVASQWVLKVWGEAYPHPTRKVDTFFDPTKGFPRPDLDVNPWVRLYLFTGITGGFIILAGLAVGNFAELRASRKLFSAMLQRIVKAPTRWYDVTPTGRILNRLVSDIDTVDFALHETFSGAIRGAMAFMVSLIVIIFVVPTFTPIALCIAWLYIRLAPNYVKTSRDLRRLESVSRSPMFQNFSNLLHGIQSIRAFSAEDRYQNLFYQSCDTFQTMDHHYWLTNFWLMWRYDCLGSVVVFLTTGFALFSGVGEGFAAISVVQSEIFAQATRSLVSVFAQLELDFNAVERITEYLQIPQEAASIIEGSRPPAYWPSDHSGLIVEDLVVKYAVHLPAALKSISFQIQPREKVGIIGRTGSGKSTLALSLLRILEPTEGKIILDGVDISKIGLEDLRTRITIVSQDVTLFEGSIRDNLDPLGIHSDEECWDVLRRCGLASREIFGMNRSSSATLSSSKNQVEPEEPNNPELEPPVSSRILVKSLDMKLSEGGKSFSVGQRQMLALARAMLRRTKVIIMDEATSSIDMQTDAQIQSTIRDCMGDSMVITIAHRLFTVLDYDKLIVLNEGEIMETGSPKSLIVDANSQFRRICEASSDWDTLKNQLLG